MLCGLCYSFTMISLDLLISRFCPCICILLRLLQLCQRTMALPVGRGLFTLFSYQPVPTEPLPVPKLNLTGNVMLLTCGPSGSDYVYSFVRKSIYFMFFYFYTPGRAPPRNTMVDLNSGNIDVPPNMTSWPSFHNGVAAGLKIAPASQVSVRIKMEKIVFIKVKIYLQNGHKMQRTQQH